MENISFTDRVKNEEVLNRVKEERNIPFNRRLGGPQRWNGCFRQKNNHLPLSKIEQRFLGHQQVFQLNTVSYRGCRNISSVILRIRKKHYMERKYCFQKITEMS